MKLPYCLIIVLFFAFGNLSAQCETHNYEYIAKKVFGRTLVSSDFSYSGIYFLTIDTLDASEFNIASDYREYLSWDSLNDDFNTFMKTKTWDGYYYNYYELINNSFYSSPLHLSFLVNDSFDTFMIDIWMDNVDFLKIQGITIMKLQQKLNKTPY